MKIWKVHFIRKQRMAILFTHIKYVPQFFFSWRRAAALKIYFDSVIILIFSILAELAGF